MAAGLGDGADGVAVTVGVSSCLRGAPRTCNRGPERRESVTPVAHSRVEPAPALNAGRAGARRRPTGSGVSALSTAHAILGTLVRVLDRHGPAGSGYSVVEVAAAPGVPPPPPHTHDRTREVFVVLQGRLEVLVGQTWHALAAGGSVEIPAGVMHSFRNDTGEPARFLAIYHPGGVERLFEAAGEPAAWPDAGASFTAPPVGPGQVERVIELAPRFDVRLPPRA